MNIRKHTRRVFLTVAVATILSSATAQAEQAPTRGPMPPGSFDRDGDGVITEQEFNTTRAEHMGAMAAQGMPMRGAANAPAFSDFDTNHDGKLTQEEMFAGRRAQMEKRRGMGPGAGMSPGMMGQGRGMGPGMGPRQGMGPPPGMGPGMMGQGRGMGPGMMGQGPGMGPPPGMGPGMMGQGRGMGPGMMGQGRGMGPGAGMGPGMMGQGRGMGPGMGRNRPDFSAYDRNGDGKISEQEFQEGRNERIRERAQQGYPMRNIGNAPAFPNLDANGDGVVSPEEFSAHQSQRGPQRAR